jgi:Zn-dependent peptidase ImmA (M78 family)
MRFSKPQIERIAREFWSKANPVHRQTLDISSAVDEVLPVRVIYIQRLSFAEIKYWLENRGVKTEFEANNRPLHGVIMIQEGFGFIFVDANDGSIQQRFTIAHEVSHFLLDYQIPRENAMLAIGTEIEDVLNGKAEATRFQQVKALIKGISIQPYTHLTEKSADGSFLNWMNYTSENEADYLALELLAPRSVVIKDTMTTARRLNYSQFTRKCEELLMKHYQIPPEVAHQYAVELAYSITNGPSFLDKLGL